MHIAYVLTSAFGDDDNESSGNFIDACLIKAYFNAHKYEPSGKTNYGRHLRGYDKVYRAIVSVRLSRRPETRHRELVNNLKIASTVANGNGGVRMKNPISVCVNRPRKTVNAKLIAVQPHEFGSFKSAVLNDFFWSVKMMKNKISRNPKIRVIFNLVNLIPIKQTVAVLIGTRQ